MKMTPDWFEQARCRKMDTSVFFPHTTEGMGIARSICGECTVKRECLKYAIDNEITHGVWGGLGEQARRTIRTRKIPLDELV